MAAATRNPTARLQHIRDEIEAITAALRASDQHGFAGNYVLRRAAERALLIISEAARSLPDDLLVQFPEVDWPGVKSLGNVLRHEYQTVDPDTLWEILTRKLPELDIVVKRMLRQFQI